ncbi:hypothetical protein ACTFSJ_27740 [Bacillus cereus group sp. MYBK12-2]|uniref:hypothetical protein n=1 Tax=Bacillus cereus group sp. MYBK12-2 TaxID=3450689 RepID=UPI0032F3A752|nr:hypothetical protein [Bacillus pacificus]HDR7653588.1 hypothetical protein [Bacillus pacificus]
MGDVTFLERKVDDLERRIEQLGKDLRKDIKDLDSRVSRDLKEMDRQIDTVNSFAVKFEALFPGMEKTVGRIEDKLDKFIEKQEKKEEQRANEERAGQQESVKRWQGVALEILKWLLIALGIGGAGESVVSILQKFM